MSELQLEIERHRKTWRQLEQVTGLLKLILANAKHGGYVCFTDKDIKEFEAALSQQAEPERHDWSEDFDHENGNYSCRCCQCGEPFAGHKRRFVCKVCDSKLEPAPAQDEPVYQLRNTAVGNVWRDADKDAYDSAAKLVEYERRALYRRPAQTEQQPEQSGLALPRAQLERIERRLTDWLELNCCECESGHSCGRNEVTADRDVIRAALSATPSPAKRGDA